MLLHRTPKFSIFFGDQKTSFAPHEFYQCADEAEIRNSPQFARVSQTIGMQRLALIKQVHGTDGLVLQNEAELPRPYGRTGDYLITNVPQVGLAIATADCLPIIIYDPAHQVVAAIHAGWRGSVAGIAQKIITDMQTTFGSQPADLHIFFGPSAGACCYEVDEQFVRELPELGPYVVQRDGKVFFDNVLYNQLVLERCGVHNFVHQYWRCTICSPDFCSYRRDGKAAKRQMTIVTLHSI